MAASYAFAVGSVRAREGSLLTRQDMEGLMLAGSDRELASLLRDKGYGDPAGRGGTEELLREETVRLWDYIWSVAPDKSLFDAFLLRNDIHNAKVALKSTLSGRDAQHLLLAPCTLPPKALYTAAEERAVRRPARLAGGGDGEGVRRSRPRLRRPAGPTPCWIGRPCPPCWTQPGERGIPWWRTSWFSRCFTPM